MAAAAENVKSEPSTSSDDISSASGKKPTCIIVLGMAGSGKTTFVQVSMDLCS